MPDQDELLSELLAEVLHFDSFAEAEKLTGKSYKDDKDTSFLGLGLAMEAAKTKRTILKQVNDAYDGIAIDDYIGLFVNQGFKEVLHIPFVSNDRNEDFYVYWSNEGLLLSFDTYRGEINSARVYYNWKPFSYENYFNSKLWLTSSGSWNCKDRDNWDKNEAVWAGDHDAREGVLFNLRRLREWGDFLNPWHHRHFLWLSHHGDRVDGINLDHYDKINKERETMLPKHVLEAINPS